jgi:hypothetical protein
LLDEPSAKKSLKIDGIVEKLPVRDDPVEESPIRNDSVEEPPARDAATEESSVIVDLVFTGSQIESGP